ncbi:MAG: dihydrodipicolinate reductase [Acidobacteria bacterium]|nr:dihydrodipicolinate reductase [Acidobacteriota bacterium]
MPYRVIQWYTGTMGKMQIDLLHRDPSYELVGAVVHSAGKAGLDAGQIAGIGEIGVTTTDDIDAALALEADCVLMTGSGGLEPDLIERILRSGKNVVSISGGYDMKREPEFEQLEAACQAGGVSLTGGGNITGMQSDVLPLIMSGYTSDVRRIWTRERNNHALYDSRGWSGTYGGPMPSADEMTARIGTSLPAGHYRQAAQICADALGVELSDFALSNYEAVAAPREIYMPGPDVTVPKGTVAGLRFEYTGYVDGEPWHVTEMEFTAAYDLGPGWKDNPDEPEFSLRIEGRPPIEMSYGVGGIVNLIWLNACRMVNLIGPLCRAGTGCRTILELPWVTATSAGRSTASADWSSWSSRRWPPAP